ncbi:transposable element Tcb1 transposase [Trichonephila clavipes]|nr:transposable element Tcb1 transposase [Trichonephila clavipes]
MFTIGRMYHNSTSEMQRQAIVTGIVRSCVSHSAAKTDGQRIAERVQTNPVFWQWKSVVVLDEIQTTVMRICDRWMQEGTTDQPGRSHTPQCTTSREDCNIAAEWNEVVCTDESRICLQHHDGRIRVWRHRGEMMLNSCVMHRHTGPAPCISVWGGIGYHSRTPLVRIADTLNCQRYISEIELLPWATHSPDFSPIENMWFMIAQQLTQITPPAETLNKLWQRVDAAWSDVPQEHIQRLFESMLRHVTTVISKNCGYSGY